MSTATILAPYIDRARGLGRQLRGRYEALGARERAMVLVAGLAVTGFGWDTALNRPAGHQLDGRNAALRVARSEVTAQRAMAARLRDGGVGTDVLALRAAVRQRSAELASSEARLREQLDGFVPVGQTEQLLEGVLARHPGLKLVSAAMMPAEPLTVGPAGSGAAAHAASEAGEPVQEGVVPGAGLYRHGVRLELSGGYLDALSYLAELERMPWRLGWDRVEYQVSTHPNGRLVIELHTISDRKEWIGA